MSKQKNGGAPKAETKKAAAKVEVKEEAKAPKDQPKETEVKAPEVKEAEVKAPEVQEAPKVTCKVVEEFKNFNVKTGYNAVITDEDELFRLQNSLLRVTVEELTSTDPEELPDVIEALAAVIAESETQAFTPRLVARNITSNHLMSAGDQRVYNMIIFILTQIGEKGRAYGRECDLSALAAAEVYAGEVAEVFAHYFDV